MRATATLLVLGAIFGGAHRGMFAVKGVHAPRLSGGTKPGALRKPLAPFAADLRQVGRTNRIPLPALPRADAVPAPASQGLVWAGLGAALVIAASVTLCSLFPDGARRRVRSRL